MKQVEIWVTAIRTFIDLKAFEPFVMEKHNRNGENYLTGFYMSKKNDNRFETNFLDLHIDTKADSSIVWKNDITYVFVDYNKIDDSLSDFRNVKYGNINIGNEDALMARAVEEVRKCGGKAWVGHFAAVVSEIELLWCSKAERDDRKNNPSHIYYVTKEETIHKQEEELYRKLKIEPKIPQAIRY
ncbi:hypothetical protein EDC94DRAFT_655889 [Helicostylum pulchrum]|nr:hypothetical protein EDC94DRAFT_655889 [Helicostylum pulchrum]